MVKHPVAVEKGRDRNIFLAAIIAAVEFLLLPHLGGGFDGGCCRLAEEPHESLDVLGCRCQEELLPHELQSPQAQAPQPDLILEFREQRFYFLSLPLCLRELGRVRQLPCPLPGGFIQVDGKKAERSAGALGF